MEPVRPVYFNRDLSWIDFNARVLGEGLRPDLPPLDRLKFLSIVASNFDEFFMVRIAALKRAAAAGNAADPSGLSPAEQLSNAAAKIRGLVARQYSCLTEEILPQLAEAGLELVRPGAYSPTQARYLEALFEREVFPLLTPLRLDPEGDFPSAGNLRPHAAFLLARNEAAAKPGKGKKPAPPASPPADGNELCAIVQLPASLDRIVWLPIEAEGRSAWTLLDDVVLTWGHRLFPGYNIKEAGLFKITRDADFAVDEERDDDFIEAMEEVLVGREQSPPVRLSVSAGNPLIRDLVAGRLGLDADDVYEMPGPIDLRSLMDLAAAKGFDHLREPVWTHWWPADLPEDEPLWERIRRRDVLIHLPYQSFDPVVRFFRDAAADPQVLAIKATLYRTSGDSPIVKALAEAAREGKQVTVLVELKARFDESRNIAWATRLEQAGVIVVYGIARLKVHAKAALAVRRETDGIKRYVYLATGNFNDRTARLYGDLGLFSANDDLAAEVGLFFNSITGYTAVQSMRKLAMAPIELKHKLLGLIDRETRRSNQEYPGAITAKMNSLADIDVINALYRASQAGVRIRLNIRGICMLVPGVPGLSDTISVISIVDRYLEHARIFHFANGGSDEVYLASADWMSRNLERRVELMFPVADAALKRRAMDILEAYFRDTSRARGLDADGAWTPLASPVGVLPYRAQAGFYAAVQADVEAAQRNPEREFVVRRRPPTLKD
jgi:polyphosphate kinase